MGAEGRTPETYIVKGGGLSLDVRDMDSVGAPWLAPDVPSWLDTLWEAVLGSLSLSSFYGRAVELHSEGRGQRPGSYVPSPSLRLLSGHINWIALIETSFPFLIFCPFLLDHE